MNIKKLIYLIKGLYKQTKIELSKLYSMIEELNQDVDSENNKK